MERSRQKPRMEGGTFRAGVRLEVAGWHVSLDGECEPWDEGELVEFGRDYLLIGLLPEVVDGEDEP